MEKVVKHSRFRRTVGIIIECALGLVLLAVVQLHLAPNAKQSLGSATASAATALTSCGSSLICITDDHTGDNLRFNCATGAYTFNHLASSLTLTGTGTVSQVNFVVSVADKQPDRKVNGGLLLSQGTGSGVVYFFPTPGGGIQVYHINQTIPFRACPGGAGITKGHHKGKHHH
jgi:hypothetical protein